MNKNIDAPIKPLTEVETEMMSIIWKIAPCSISEIIKHLPETRDLAYTSVATIVRILEQKKVLSSIKEGKTHIYSPLVTKAEYEKSLLNHIVEKVFDGSANNLLKCLFHSKKISKEFLEEMKQIIDTKNHSS